MENSLYVGLSGQVALQEKMALIANNVANINTPGYRGQNAVFHEFISDQTRMKEDVSLVYDYGQYQVTDAGPIKQTGNALDVSLVGPGFLGVQTSEGVQYTRAGNFSRSADGQLVTAQGYAVLPQIAIPDGATAITVAADGTVSAVIAGSAAPSELGQITLASFANPAGLQAAGDNFLLETAASGPAQVGPGGEAGRGNIRQGMLEASNVNVVEELVDMIEAQRAYEINSKMISAVDDMLRNANQTL